MAEIPRCPKCGTELSGETPEGLCPKCLLSAGLENTEADQVAASDFATIAPTRQLSSSPAGTRIRYFGDYELLEEIARGGMGVVYKARQVRLNRTVALKMILAGQLASDDDVKRFHTEAEAAANLQHANIVAIHEVGEHEEQHYFSMDYVDGSSLADQVRHHPLGARKAAELVKDIAQAVHYAHGQGTLHRDLKPANILIDQSSQPRITDFGLAKRIEGASKLTASGAVLGTPSYMPPEQAAANRGLIGPASDVYSLGAVLYELLTGRPPFQAETPLDTLMQVLEQEPVSPQLLNANVPTDLATICLKCLEKRPDGRYRSAQELADDLERLLNHEPIHARPVSSMRRLWSWWKRHPWAITAVASLLAVGLLSCAYWLWVENEVLRWSVTQPDYVREAGSRTSTVENVAGFLLAMCAPLFIIQSIFAAYARRCKREGVSVSFGSLATYGFVGLTSIVLGIYVAKTAIDAHIWENHDISPGWFAVFFIYWGGLFLVNAVREYELITFGSATQPIQASDQTLEEIQNLFLNDDGAAKKRKSHVGGNQTRRATIHYIKATGAKYAESRLAVEQIQTELHRKYPDKVPAVADELAFRRGFFGLMLMFLGPICLLIVVAGMSAEALVLAGVAWFSAATGATVTFRRNNRQFTRRLLVFVVLSALLLLSVSGVLIALYSVWSILIASLISLVVGLGYGCVIPHSRFAEDTQPQAADWRSRFVKVLLLVALGSFAFGLMIVVGLTISGSASMNSDRDFLIFFPVLLAAGTTFTAGVAVSILRYVHWLLSSD